MAERTTPLTLVAEVLLCQTSAMAPQSSLYVALEKLLGSSLEAFVTSRRPALSWRAIAAELETETGAAVSHESLRGWFFADDETPAASRGSAA